MKRAFSRFLPVLALAGWTVVAATAVAAPDDATQRVQDLRAEVTTVLQRGIIDPQVRLDVRTKINSVVEAWTVATLNHDGTVLEPGFAALFDARVTPVLHGQRLGVRSSDLRRFTQQLAEAEIARQTAE